MRHTGLASTHPRGQEAYVTLYAMRSTVRERERVGRACRVSHDGTLVNLQLVQDLFNDGRKLRHASRILDVWHASTPEAPPAQAEKVRSASPGDACERLACQLQ